MRSVRVSAVGVSTVCEQSNNEIIAADADQFNINYCRSPFTITHNLAGHPLFELSRLVELSKQLPREHVKYNAGNIPVTEQLYRGPQNGLSIEETIRRIEECGSWMVLKFVERDAEYAALLNSCLDDVDKLAGPSGPTSLRRQGFIFITSPRSVTPYHADPEHGFLLQIRGRKSMSVIDDTFISHQEYEKYFAKGEGPDFKDECKGAARAFELSPGAGLHIPFASPHWVENGDEVSVSFSITFRTSESERKSIVYKMNHSLRKRGLRPKPYGESRLRDSAKFYGFRAVRKARRIVGLSEPDQSAKY